MSLPEIEQWVIWIIASCGSVIVGFGTTPISMLWVPIRRAAFMQFVSWGL
jgi:hypothetical protein